MGQRNQLMWDIPVVDSFDRNRVVYRLGRDEYRVSDLTVVDPLVDEVVDRIFTDG